MKKKLAVFDFDGTLTSKDSMLEFIRYTQGSSALYGSLLMLSPFLILYKLGLFSNAKAKQMLLRQHFKGRDEQWLSEKAESFCRKKLPNFLREKALDQLQFHRQNQHDVVIITASLDFWVKPWLERQKLDYICTVSEFIDGKFTGRIVGENCYGPEKLRRLKARYQLDQYDTIYAYGDSRGDREILKAATRGFYKPFRS